MPGNAKRVLILGRGAMGQAFEAMLSPRHEIASWDRDLQTGVETQPLEVAARNREVVVFALPAHPHDELAERLASCLDANALCLSIAKGLDDRGRTAAQIFEHRFARRIDWALLYGPMLARELHAGSAGFAMAASARPEIGERLIALFESTPLRIDLLDDVHGAAWAAILKNVYVPLIGACDGLALGDNVRGFLIAEAVGELARIVRQMGGHPETAYTLAGLGDLVTSATSASSHHRRIGADLAVGWTDHLAASGMNIRSEGVHAAAKVREYALFEWERFPLFELVCRFLDDPAQLRQRLDRYLDDRFASGR